MPVVFGVEFDVLTSLAQGVLTAIDAVGGDSWEFVTGLSLAIGGIALAFGLLSAYWLWHLWQFMSTSEDGRTISEQVAQQNDHYVAASWTRGRKVMYMAKPLLVSIPVAALIVFVPVGLAETTGATPFMIFAPMGMQFGSELIFVGAVVSVYRLCKIMI